MPLIVLKLKGEKMFSVNSMHAETDCLLSCSPLSFLSSCPPFSDIAEATGYFSSTVVKIAWDSVSHFHTQKYLLVFMQTAHYWSDFYENWNVLTNLNETPAYQVSLNFVVWAYGLPAEV